MQVCEAGKTLAQRCVVVCDVHVSGAFTMNNRSYLCCIFLHFYFKYSLSSWVFISHFKTFLKYGKKYYLI